MLATLAASACGIVAARAQDGPAADAFKYEGLEPEAAARAMTVPEGFRVSLFAGEPDVVQPIAMAVDDRGRVWVAEAYNYPRRLPEDQARDRILILEDADNDGRFDSRKVFAEKLNLVSGIEVGFGGVWVGAAPHFLFIPDRDRDDRPDGPPEVLLDGWGYQDTHETLNSFIWGPDGWLYGCHGVFTFSRVGKPGTPEKERVPINAGVWRYHPTKHRFEVFAHGTSNPWGIDFDGRGQCFIEACVIPHLYHLAQGGRYERQAGQHYNAHTYDDIKTIADHRHYLGSRPHAGNGRSDAAGGGHAHAGLLIYQGDAWPEEYRGSLLMNNIHGARLNRDVVTPKGSGFVGSHRPDFLMANDRWSQVVALHPSPDGGMYMIDWYDKNQCHRNEVEVHDRTNGRIFKVSHGETRPAAPDLARLHEAGLLDVILPRLAFDAGSLELPPLNAWASRHARRLLQERGLSDKGRARLERAVTTAVLRPAFDGIRRGGEERFADRYEAWIKQARLVALWTLHVAGGLGEDLIPEGLATDLADLRAWTIQLACEDLNPSDATLAKLAEMARTDPSPVVRLYLASAVQRLPESLSAAKWAVVRGLVQHGEDADDPNLPLMVWYALEPLVTGDPGRALALAEPSPLPRLLEFTVRRVGAIGTPDAIALLVDRLGATGTSEARATILRGLNEALAGQRLVARPPHWDDVFGRLRAGASPELEDGLLALGSTFGDATAIAGLRGILYDPAGPVDRRSAALAALLKTRDEQLPGTLRGLIGMKTPLRAQAIRGLAAFDDAEIPEAILSVYPDLAAPEKRDALATLTARPASASALLDAVAAKQVPAVDLTADLVRQIQNLKQEDLDRKVREVWGTVRESSADKLRLASKYRSLVQSTAAQKPDPKLGRAVFAKTCGQCHTLFGAGGQVGPDLTGSNRADLDYVLTNVVDPSAVVGKDYQAHVVATRDGRVVTGLLKAEDGNAVTLATATETVVVPKAEIEERQITDQSLMPEDQWAPLSDHEIRSLVNYLASPAQVALPEGAEPAKAGEGQR